MFIEMSKSWSRHAARSSLSFFILAIGICSVVGCDSKKVGDKCETYRSSECSGEGATCMGNNASNYCTVTCVADKDCPASWKCQETTSTTINGKGETKGEKKVKMCIRP